jgi:hypothetical protein
VLVTTILRSCHLRRPQCLTTHTRGKRVLCAMTTKAEPMYEFTDGLLSFSGRSLTCRCQPNTYPDFLHRSPQRTTFAYPFCTIPTTAAICGLTRLNRGKCAISFQNLREKMENKRIRYASVRKPHGRQGLRASLSVYSGHRSACCGCRAAIRSSLIPKAAIPT